MLVLEERSLSVEPAALERLPLFDLLLEEALTHQLLGHGPQVLNVTFPCPTCGRIFEPEVARQTTTRSAKTPTKTVSWGVLTWRFTSTARAGVVHTCSECARRIYDVLLGRITIYESNGFTRNGSP